jgi:hypothetical protein
MPDPTVAAIEALRVYAVELAHPLGEIRLGCLDQQMVVIAHQAIGITTPLKAPDHLSQHTQKTSPGRFIQTDVFPSVASRGHLINCARKFSAERSGYGVKLKAPNALMQDLTPYPAYTDICCYTPSSTTQPLLLSKMLHSF